MWKEGLQHLEAVGLQEVCGHRELMLSTDWMLHLQQ